MRDCKRVRYRVLWQDGKYRMIRHLVVYGGGDGTWEAPYYTKPHIYWQVQEQHDGWLDGWYSLWEALDRGFVDNSYLYADTKRRRQITREKAQQGREWLAKHLRLIAANPWELRCDSIDGEGTPCPIQYEGQCSIGKWLGHGYVGLFGNNQRGLPGVCDAPATQNHFPSSRDDSGNTHLYYRNLLKEKTS